jgi:hypothetical protein
MLAAANSPVMSQSRILVIDGAKKAVVPPDTSQRQYVATNHRPTALPPHQSPSTVTLQSVALPNPSVFSLTHTTIFLVPTPSQRDGTWLVSCASFGGSSRYSNRCTALTPSSVQLYESIGVWDRVQLAHSHPYQAMQVWDACSPGSIWLDCAEASTLQGRCGSSLVSMLYFGDTYARAVLMSLGLRNTPREVCFQV